MTNYEKWQLEKYGNIVGESGEKNGRQLSTREKIESLLDQLKNNNIRILDLVNEIPDVAFKNKCLDKLLDINENTLKTISTLIE